MAMNVGQGDSHPVEERVGVSPMEGEEDGVGREEGEE